MVMITYIPKVRLNMSQTITIGANVLPILEVPKGCMRNRAIKIAQLMPTIWDVVMFGSTTFRPVACQRISVISLPRRLLPCIAPKID
jgi:hypothetical protein